MCSSKELIELFANLLPEFRSSWALYRVIKRVSFSCFTDRERDVKCILTKPDLGQSLQAWRIGDYADTGAELGTAGKKHSRQIFKVHQTRFALQTGISSKYSYQFANIKYFVFFPAKIFDPITLALISPAWKKLIGLDICNFARTRDKSQNVRFFARHGARCSHVVCVVVAHRNWLR